MHLHCWRAPLVLMGPPLGSYAVREPMMEFREGPLCWLHVLANLRTLVALLHGVVAGLGLYGENLLGPWQVPCRI